MAADPKGIFSRQIAESSAKERKARGERPREEAPNIFIWSEGKSQRLIAWERQRDKIGIYICDGTRGKYILVLWYQEKVFKQVTPKYYLYLQLEIWASC